MTKPFQHERRLQRIAYAALGIATLLGILAARQGDGKILGIAVSFTISLALLGAGLIVGVISVARRSTWLAAVAASASIIGILPGGAIAPGISGYAIGLAYAAALLAFGELVHMMRRYEIAHKAVESDGLPEDHLNRVTDEALKTLAGRTGLALIVAGAGVVLAFVLSFIGPRQWRDALETTAPVGVAISSLVLLGLGSLIILFRGALLPWRRPTPTTQEIAPDVAE